MFIGFENGSLGHSIRPSVVRKKEYTIPPVSNSPFLKLKLNQYHRFEGP